MLILFTVLAVTDVSPVSVFFLYTGTGAGWGTGTGTGSCLLGGFSNLSQVIYKARYVPVPILVVFHFWCRFL